MKRYDAMKSQGLDPNDHDLVMELAGDGLCELCNAEIEKNLHPQNPTCEGRWCSEAIDLWLNEEAKESTDGET